MVPFTFLVEKIPSFVDQMFTGAGKIRMLINFQLLVIPLRMLEFTANSSSEKRLLARCCVAAMVLLSSQCRSLQVAQWPPFHGVNHGEFPSNGHPWPSQNGSWPRSPGGAVPRPLSASASLAARGTVVPWPCDLQRSRTSGGQQGEGDGAVQALPGANCPTMGRGMEDDGGLA